MRRSLYLVIFVLLSGIAGLFYYSETRQATAVIAARDLTVGTRIQDSDVSLKQVNPASVNHGVLKTLDQAVGQVVSVPILEGQFVDTRQVAPARNAAMLGSGLEMPAGYRIIGLPVAPAAAVGGVLKPGDRVDVMAIAGGAKVTTLLDQPLPTPILLGKDVLVIGLRTEQGTPVDQAEHGINTGGGKLASILLAISQTDEETYSAAIANSTFVLTLSTD